MQNYQIITSVPSNSDNLGLRLSRSVTTKDRLAGSYNFQHRNGTNQQLLGFGYQSYFQPFWVMATRPLTRPEQFLSRTSDRDRVR